MGGEVEVPHLVAHMSSHLSGSVVVGEGVGGLAGVVGGGVVLGVGRVGGAVGGGGVGGRGPPTISRSMQFQNCSDVWHATFPGQLLEEVQCHCMTQ